MLPLAESTTVEPNATFACTNEHMLRTPARNGLTTTTEPPISHKQRGRYVMPNAPSPKTQKHPKLARRYGPMKSQQPLNGQMSPKNDLRASPYEQATPHRLIKSAKTQRLRAEQAGTLASNTPKSSEDKRAFRKSNNKRM